MEPRTLQPGYNTLAGRQGPHEKMLMDIGVYQFAPGEKVSFFDEDCESAFLLLDGEIELCWGQKKQAASRGSLFDEKPTVLHVPRRVPVEICAAGKAEVLIQKTLNDRDFEAIFYPPEDIRDVLLGADILQGAARRVLRDVFNYSNAPYSNMVLGEDLHFPGRWSSYPPHHHDQPEVYYYRFDRPQGFGVSIVGEEPAIVMDNSISAIPGGLDHPQACAPGYAMFYVWMIRHLEGNPWTARVDNPAHAWLHDPDAPLWQGPPDIQPSP